ncbi:MAG: DUF885 domain-containing protein [Gammaproteobacteria bacterium]|nr:DUF885 domain-containing protein [Gammaproteobacteria bacterium]|tara:strand:+ start:115 stop:1965 length:1851 start_codon:yes stop_codon:yes gene_type:complete
MKHTLRRVIPVSLLALLLACSPASEPAPPSTTLPATDTQPASAQTPTTEAPAAIEDFFAQFTDQWVRANPNLAISTGYFDGDEQNQLEQQITPLTLAQEQRIIALARDGLAQLDRYDLDQESDAVRISADVMRWSLQRVIDSEAFLAYEFPLQQMNGANVGLVNQLTVVHPLRSANDAENYLTRLQLLDDRMREATAEAARRAATGIIPPTFILQTTVEQMDRFISNSPRDNPLATTLFSKTGSVEELTEDQRVQLLERAAMIVEEEVYPAWRDAIGELQAQLPSSTNDAGLWAIEGGDAYYATQLKRFTTTDLTADEIHQIGLREVARIETQMDALMRQIGLNEGTVEERATTLQQRLAYPNTDQGRAALMDDIEIYLRDAESRAESLFDNRPTTPVIAQPYPEFRWANAAASYTSPPLDGSRPGIFQMPLREDRLSNFTLRTLVYHETVPGHHFQIALITENDELPRFMQIRAFGGISASSEGWALYAERLAAEEGWYEDDIEGLLGQLDSELFRARRLVVDTGLHAKQWTRQQAIDYGIPPSEVDRYVVYPGQATSYMIGQLRIIELRERARETLGDRFSMQDFHNVVLNLGVVPLTVLEREVDAYIAAASEV